MPACSTSSSGDSICEGATVATAAGTRPARGIAAAAGREAILAAENRDLVVRLTATHRKLKLLRSRSQQREALQDAKVSFKLCLLLWQSAAALLFFLHAVLVLVAFL
jgi:hypothetical protein